MAESWVAVEALTGNIITDLTDLDVGSVSQTLGRYETATAKLPVSADVASPDWLRATKPGASFLIQLDPNPSDSAHGIPQWGGLVNRRTRDATDEVKLDLITAEGYLDRRFVGDELFEGVGQNALVEYLVETYVADGPGIPIRVEVVSDGDGQERDREYFDKDDKTILSVLQDLMGVIGGPEWTIGWEWQSSPERLTPVLYVGDRIGSSPMLGLTPNSTFDLPGCVSKLTMVEDFGSGKGANSVMATSSGQGDLRPQSSPVLTADPERPLFEYRFAPSTSISVQATLDAHAETAAAVLASGSTAIALSADLDGAPALGVDWFIGDDVTVQAGVLPAFPSGLDEVGRVGGWIRSFGNTQTITPVLLVDGDIDG